MWRLWAAAAVDPQIRYTGRRQAWNAVHPTKSDMPSLALLPHVFVWGVEGCTPGARCGRHSHP